MQNIELTSLSAPNPTYKNSFCVQLVFILYLFSLCVHVIYILFISLFPAASSFFLFLYPRQWRQQDCLNFHVWIHSLVLLTDTHSVLFSIVSVLLQQFLFLPNWTDGSLNAPVPAIFMWPESMTLWELMKVWGTATGFNVALLCTWVLLLCNTNWKELCFDFTCVYFCGCWL